MLALSFAQPSCECVHFELKEGMPDLKPEDILTGFAILDCDVGSTKTDEELFSLLARVLQFPDYFGKNWDALDECLRDLGNWLPANGYILVLNGASGLWKEATITAGRLVMSWQFCAEVWRAENVPFHLVFVLEDR